MSRTPVESLTSQSPLSRRIISSPFALSSGRRRRVIGRDRASGRQLRGLCHESRRWFHMQGRFAGTHGLRHVNRRGGFGGRMRGYVHGTCIGVAMAECHFSAFRPPAVCILETERVDIFLFESRSRHYLVIFASPNAVMIEICSKVWVRVGKKVDLHEFALIRYTCDLHSIFVLFRSILQWLLPTRTIRNQVVMFLDYPNSFYATILTFPTFDCNLAFEE